MQIWTRFCETIFWGFGFRKTETNFQKRIFGIGFRPAGGVWGGMRGGFFFGFWRAGNCIFCKINNKEAPAKIVFENDDILAFTLKEQVSKGHTLVVPKKHFENIFDIDKNTLEKLIAVS